MAADPLETRQRILRAFADTYAEAGVADLTVVARAAGVSRSTVYRHYRSAREMLEAARAEGMADAGRRMEQHLAPALRGDPGADLIDGVTALLSSIFHDGIAYAGVLRRDAEADATLHAHYARFAEEIVRRAQRDGVIASHLDPAALYTASVALCRSLVTATDAGDVDPGAALGIARTFFEALRPAPPAAPPPS